MNLLISKATQETFTNKYIFLDNDFLSLISEDFQAFRDTLELCKRGSLYIDTLTRIEFLRDTFVPRLREVKEKFIDNYEIFSMVTDSSQIFETIRKNALYLSYLYAHSGSTSASTVDLLIAGRALLYVPRSLIITGNRKDFPSVLFETEGVLNYEEEKGGQVRAFSIVSFNRDKYDSAVQRLSRVRS